MNLIENDFSKEILKLKGMSPKYKVRVSRQLCNKIIYYRKHIFSYLL